MHSLGRHNEPGVKTSRRGHPFSVALTSFKDLLRRLNLCRLLDVVKCVIHSGSYAFRDLRHHHVLLDIYILWWVFLTL